MFMVVVWCIYSLWQSLLWGLAYVEPPPLCGFSLLPEDWQALVVEGCRRLGLTIVGDITEPAKRLDFCLFTFSTADTFNEKHWLCVHAQPLSFLRVKERLIGRVSSRV